MQKGTMIDEEITLRQLKEMFYMTPDLFYFPKIPSRTVFILSMNKISMVSVKISMADYLKYLWFRLKSRKYIKMHSNIYPKEI